MLRIEWLIRPFMTGTNLDPTEVIGRARNGKKLLPPRSRSPIKTNIGSSPRRSLGPVSSPSRIWNGATPTRPMSHPPENMFMSRRELTPSIEGSDKKGGKSELNVKKLQVNGKGKKRAFDLSMASESDEDERNLNDMNGANETNGGGFDDSALVQNEVEVSQMLPEDGTLSGELDIPLGGSEGEITEVIPETTTIVKRRPGRPPKAASTNPNASQNIPGQKARGRPPKKAKKDATGDENVVQEESSGAVAAADQGADEAAPEMSKDPETETSERDPNAKMKPPPRASAKSSLKKPKGTKTASGKPKSLIAVRRETPANDKGAIRTRSGRNSIPRLKYWQGEVIRYGGGRKVGNVITLPGITEVVRTDEIEVPRPKRYTSRRSRPKRQIKDEEDEDEDERAPWENQTGIVRAHVMQWDHAIGKYDEENSEETGEHFRIVSRSDEPH